MPSFAFWKSSKPDESKSPLLSDAAVKAELSVIIPNTSKAVDLNPGSQDAGVFLFDEDATEIPGDETPVVERDPNVQNKTTLEQSKTLPSEHTSNTAETNNSLLDIDEQSPCPHSPALVPEAPSNAKESSTNKATNIHKETAADIADIDNHTPHGSSPVPEPASAGKNSVPSIMESSEVEGRSSSAQPQALSPVPKEAGLVLDVEKRTVRRRMNTIETNMRDRDSGVYMSDSEGSPNFSRPFSVDWTPENTSKVALKASATVTSAHELDSPTAAPC
jgi:hypothetical protein